MKIQLTGIFVLLIVFLAGITIGANVGLIKDKFDLSAVVQEKLENTDNQVENTGEDDYIGTYKVLKVFDGDTIEIEGGERVRYIGINAPEIGECYYEEARENNREIVLGKKIRLEKDSRNRDKYQRLLRYVYIGEEMINEKLVTGGFAISRSYEPDTGKQGLLDDAEEQARRGNLGIWKECPEINE